MSPQEDSLPLLRKDSIFSSWQSDAKAYLRRKEVFGRCLTASTDVVANEKCVGILWGMLSADVKPLVKQHEDDPKALGDALATIYHKGHGSISGAQISNGFLKYPIDIRAADIKRIVKISAERISSGNQTDISRDLDLICDWDPNDSPVTNVNSPGCPCTTVKVKKPPTARRSPPSRRREPIAKVCSLYLTGHSVEQRQGRYSVLVVLHVVFKLQPEVHAGAVDEWPWTPVLSLFVRSTRSETSSTRSVQLPLWRAHTAYPHSPSPRLLTHDYRFAGQQGGPTRAARQGGDAPARDAHVRGRRLASTLARPWGWAVERITDFFFRKPVDALPVDERLHVLVTTYEARESTLPARGALGAREVHDSVGKTRRATFASSSMLPLLLRPVAAVASCKLYKMQDSGRAIWPLQLEAALVEAFPAALDCPQCMRPSFTAAAFDILMPPQSLDNPRGMHIDVKWANVMVLSPERIKDLASQAELILTRFAEEIDREEFVEDADCCIYLANKLQHNCVRVTACTCSTNDSCEYIDARESHEYGDRSSACAGVWTPYRFVLAIEANGERISALAAPNAGLAIVVRDDVDTDKR
ncbi:hypothetical protein GGX14DRAFT_580162 [Mycena pura]|uniref:Uncharacterized protein n=1 Tax=Mycena pura TaxID=153505 RepID=A0AAD6UQG0_9AGAR|nr:hypothetical protein GGX14DRAFT_580162 [Mycena pura]